MIGKPFIGDITVGKNGNRQKQTCVILPCHNIAEAEHVKIALDMFIEQLTGHVEGLGGLDKVIEEGV